MIYITTLQGATLQSVIDGYKTVKDIATHTGCTGVQVTSYLAVLRAKELIASSDSKQTNKCYKIYRYTGKEFFAGRSVTEETGSVIEAIDLGHTRTKQIIEHTGHPRGVVTHSISLLLKYDIIKRGKGSVHKGFEYSTTSKPWWVKDYDSAARSQLNSRLFKYDLCDYVIYKMPVYGAAV